MKSENLVEDVLLELQLLLQGLQAVLGVHSPQHLVLQLLLGIGQVSVQLGENRREEERMSAEDFLNRWERGREKPQIAGATV